MKAGGMGDEAPRDGSGLEGTHLTKVFKPGGFRVLSAAGSATTAVDDVGITVTRGSITGLAGESGCGKSTLGRMLVGLERPTNGVVELDGEPVGSSPRRVGFGDRRLVQMVFQDPTSSLNPRRTVGQSIAMPLSASGLARRDELRPAVESLLREVDLVPSEGFVQRYPHQLSGGQRQRAAIARALAPQPRFIVADEPVSSLDVLVQAKLLEVFSSIAATRRVGVLFISHDLGALAKIAQDVAVMYLGRIVERGPTRQVLRSPQHHYTRGLLDSVPSVSAGGGRANARDGRKLLAGEPPSLREIQRGCRFQARCARAQPRCASDDPPLSPGPSGWEVACHYPLESHERRNEPARPAS